MSKTVLAPCQLKEYGREFLFCFCGVKKMVMKTEHLMNSQFFYGTIQVRRYKFIVILDKINIGMVIMVALTFYWYPKCGTCRKAKKWLDDHEVQYKDIHIVENPPSRAELQELYKQSGLEIKKFFNTSGKKYRELGLKDKVKTASEEELLDLLASDGMLIKRPLTTDGEKVTVGFNEETFEKTWL